MFTPVGSVHTVNVPHEIRDEANRLYELWQLDARQRGRLHDFLGAIARARACADAADQMGEHVWARVEPSANDAIRRARELLTLAGARP